MAPFNDQISQIMNFRNIILTAVFSILLTGCSVLDWMVYKIDIPQGNFIEEEQVAQLRIAMSKEQVTYILGSSMLVDTFEPDTWYYMYHYQEGNGDRTLERKELTLSFKNNKLTKMTGDYEPSPEFNTPLDIMTSESPSDFDSGTTMEAVPEPTSEMAPAPTSEIESAEVTPDPTAEIGSEAKAEVTPEPTSEIKSEAKDAILSEPAT